MKSSDGKESACNLGDPELWRSPGEGNGYPLHYSCLENSMREELVAGYSPQWQRVRHDWPTNTSLQPQWSLVFIQRRWCSVYGRTGRVVVSVTQSHPTLRNPMDCSLNRLLCPWNSLAKNTGVGKHSLLQRIFSTKRVNTGLQHCRQILYHCTIWEAQQDWKGILYYELLPEKQTINSNKYCSPLELKTALDEKCPELVNREHIIFHQDNTRPHVSYMTRQKLL